MSRGALTEERVDFGDTTFEFRRPLPLEALWIFEALRPSLTHAAEPLGKALDEGGDMSQNAKFLTAAMHVIGSLPEEIVRKAMTLLMQHVYVSRNGEMPTKASLDLDSALKGRTVVEIYEILIRAFCVNFTDSFAGVQSALGALQAVGASQRGT